jgi:hypothetical protein
VVYVDSDEPVITITSPAAGSVYGPSSTVGITALLTDSSGIDWTATLDGNNVGSGHGGSASGEVQSFGISTDFQAEGAHTFAISGTDAVGRSVGPASVTFHVDKSGPGIVVSSPSANPYYLNPAGPTPPVPVTAAGADYFVWIGPTLVASGTDGGPIDLYSYMGDLAHESWRTIHVRAVDDLGNESNSYTSVMADTEDPDDMSFTYPPAGRVLQGDSSPIEGKAWDTSSGGDHVELTIFNVDVDNECNGQAGTIPVDEYAAGWWSTDFDTRTFHDGKYCLRITGYDRAGNSTDAWLQNLTIDNTGPTVPVAVSPVRWVDGAGSRVLDWTDSTDLNGPVTYEYRIGESEDLEGDAFAHGILLDQSQIDLGSELTGGPYYWQARAKDSLGNFSDWSSTATFRVLGAPVIDTCGCEFSSEFRNSLRVDWDYEFHGRVDQYQVRYHYEGDQADDGDDRVYLENAGTARHFTRGFSVDDPEGAWFVRVRAKVAAGTWTEWSERVRFVRDVTDPETPTLVLPDDGAPSGLSDWFKWTKSEDDLYQFRFSVDGVIDGHLIGPMPFDPYGTGELLVFDGHRLPVPYFAYVQGVPEGDFWWQVRAVDAAGNKSGWSDIWQTTIDLTEPERVQLDFPADASARSVDDVTFGWRAPVETGLSYQLEVGPSPDREDGALVGSTRHDVGSLDLLRSDLPEGTWFWRVRAIDAAGNKGQWSTVWSVTIDVPTVTPPAPPAKGGSGSGALGSTEETPTPTPTPSDEPTEEPTDEPSEEPTDEPSPEPTEDAEASDETDGGFPLFWLLIAGIVLVVITAGAFIIRRLVRR